MTKTKTITAYHFTGDKLRDGRPVPPVGEWLEHDGPLKLCSSGLHASIHPFDALRYAPGNLLHLVECSGEIIEGDDKLVCSRRRIIKSIDAEQLLRGFARKCALNIYPLWGNEKTDPGGIVKRYLKTGDESIRAATWDSAWAAAWDAGDSARDAAWDAWDSAWDSAWAAAWAAARAAAGDPQKKQRAQFKRMVSAAFKEPNQ